MNSDIDGTSQNRSTVEPWKLLWRDLLEDQRYVQAVPLLVALHTEVCDQAEQERACYGGNRNRSERTPDRRIVERRCEHYRNEDDAVETGDDDYG